MQWHFGCGPPPCLFSLSCSSPPDYGRDCPLLGVLVLGLCALQVIGRLAWFSGSLRHHPREFGGSGGMRTEELPLQRNASQSSDIQIYCDLLVNLHHILCRLLRVVGRCREGKSGDSGPVPGGLCVSVVSETPSKAYIRKLTFFSSSGTHATQRRGMASSTPCFTRCLRGPRLRS